MAIREFYWYEGKDGKCPFDSFLLGKPVPNFKSDDGKVRLNIQKCPLCHKTFVEYRPDLDCLRYNSNDNDQYISCRFLYPRTKTILQRQRKEEKNNANLYEPSPADFHKYRLLISKYDISEKWFCECFDADIEEYRYFADNYRNIGDKLLPLKAALISSGIRFFFITTSSRKRSIILKHSFYLFEHFYTTPRTRIQKTATTIPTKHGQKRSFSISRRDSGMKRAMHSR